MVQIEIFIIIPPSSGQARRFSVKLGVLPNSVISWASSSASTTSSIYIRTDFRAAGIQSVGKYLLGWKIIALNTKRPYKFELPEYTLPAKCREVYFFETSFWENA